MARTRRFTIITAIALLVSALAILAVARYATAVTRSTVPPQAQAFLPTAPLTHEAYGPQAQGPISAALSAEAEAARGTRPIIPAQALGTISQAQEAAKYGGLTREVWGPQAQGYLPADMPSNPEAVRTLTRDVWGPQAQGAISAQLAAEAEATRVVREDFPSQAQGFLPKDMPSNAQPARIWTREDFPAAAQGFLPKDMPATAQDVRPVVSVEPEAGVPGLRLADIMRGWRLAGAVASLGGVIAVGLLAWRLLRTKPAVV